MNAFDTLLSYLPLALLGIVLLGGALMAIIRIGQHPSVSMMVLFGCLLLFTGIVGVTLVERFLWSSGKFDPSKPLFAIVRWGRILLEVAGFVMLFCAAFG